MANIKTLGRKISALSTKFATVAKALAEVVAEYEAVSSSAGVVGKAETVERRKPEAKASPASVKEAKGKDAKNPAKAPAKEKASRTVTITAKKVGGEQAKVKVKAKKK